MKNCGGPETQASPAFHGRREMKRIRPLLLAAAVPFCLAWAVPPCRSQAKPGAQARSLPDIPSWAFEKMVKKAAVLKGAPKAGTRFRQLLDAVRTVWKLGKNGKTADPTRGEMALVLLTEYGPPGKLLLPMTLELQAVKIGRSAGKKSMVLDSTRPKDLPENIRKALAILTSGVIKVRLDRKTADLMGIHGHEKLLLRALEPLKDPRLKQVFSAFFQGVLSEGGLESTVYRLHPPIPPGKLEPGQAFYKSLRMELPLFGMLRVQLQYFFLGTCKVGGRPAGAFWSRLIFPPIERKKIRVQGREILLTQPKAVVKGLVRVDLETGHALTMDLEVTHNQTMGLGGREYTRRVVQKVKLRTFASKAPRKGGRKKDR